MSTDRVLFDKVASLRTICPRAKVLYADVCMVTALFKDRCYKFGYSKAAARIGCSRKTYYRCRKQLIENGLAKRRGNILVPLYPFSKTKNPDPLRFKSPLLKEGGEVTRDFYLQQKSVASIPIYVEDERIPAAFSLVKGMMMVSPNANVPTIIRATGLSEKTVRRYKEICDRIKEISYGELERSV